jgi:hypothetical protein
VRMKREEPEGSHQVALQLPTGETVTRRQLLVLQHIDHQTKTLGYPPTLRELMKLLGFTGTNGIHTHLQALRRKGCLAEPATRSRVGTCLTPRGREVLDAAAPGAPTLRAMRMGEVVPDARPGFAVWFTTSGAVQAACS